MYGPSGQSEGLSRPHHRPRAAFWAVGAAAGITLSTKELAAGSFVAAVLPLVLVRWLIFVRHRRATLELVAITLSTAVPWVLLAYIRYGETLVDELIREQVLARATGDIAGTPANTAGASYNEQEAFALAVNEQLDPDEPVYLTPTATKRLALFTFGFYIDALLATVPEMPPDDEYLVVIEPAPDRVTPRTVAGGAEAVVAVAVKPPMGER